MNTDDKKWALVTGALGGIGRALVEEYSRAGYRVIATDVKEASDSFAGLGNVSFLQLNLEKIAQSEEFSLGFYRQVQLVTDGVPISTLVNNAAVQILSHSRNMSREQWLSSFNVNLTAPFFLSQLFLNDLEKTHGSIVNISSIHATQTKKEFVAYATTKAALSSMTRNMVLDLGNKVRINAIEPAAIATEMLKAGFEGKEDKYRQLEAFHPTGRIGTPEEVAKLAVFLSSDDAGFVQGACISASGGISGCLSDPD
ncbi:short-chain dehydrogenase [Vibrio parahaemolyticus]|uniref:SDR family NAD(P)-dependent oxidoreductase n=1 Tax=Vibrio parahaemolyticus TaxID=670 RepID=UPI0011216A22|nr:SDR family oxidoreductase [Vibrio parahaemolyticus]TOF41924.1 short-chain dehydrogenase [Vibrio parahaemolyticus]TOF50429.1 short-chain dehydrogenase [Vibrio parahaemolyticus]TOP56240.1 short-chain dehydrogenase [Vibrio parahaemolyticus]HCG5236626.1 SDR family oxidoreductase [Vibrio parahaemolyticus]HCG7072777.1 SDR family oxidoreductase [Vibrio parahaemolyticus]